MEADFSGWATKAGLVCSDGRTIMPDAFKHQDKITVPLVWQHGHNDSGNILGHAVLENRSEGVYAYGYFNSTPQGLNAKALVEHQDIDSLSIYANKLVEKSKQVFHGFIKEVSLVLSGANPGAKIDFVAVQHSDGDIETLEDEAVIFTGLSLQHEDKPAATDDKKTEEEVEHADGVTLQSVYDSLSDDQKQVVTYMVGAALQAAGDAQHSDEPNNEGDLNHKEGTDVTRNVFEQKNGDKKETPSLSHDDIRGIVSSAEKSGSLKAAVEEYALAHGIDNIDILFPDARAIESTPEFDSRRMEWVANVMNGTKHTPFSRIKSLSADLRFDEARAKGYIKGTMKKEEFFAVRSRVTTPTTIYKKQKLDRDDIIDITDFDVVAWLKAEMRVMLQEEIAGAVLFGDGRDVEDTDKINESNIRPIASDDELYVATVNVNIADASSSSAEIVDAVLTSRTYYKGSGTPTMYTTEAYLTGMLLLKDTLGRRLYTSIDQLAAELRVAAIVPVEAMEDRAPDVVAIIVNLSDYTIGADRGGDINMFDDFDIDYNQYKYLIETRISGALTKIRSAIVVRSVAGGDVLLTTANAPTFVSSTGIVTIVATTHVVYKDQDGNTLSTGAQTALAPGEAVEVHAEAASGYYFADDVQERWTFRRDRS